MNVYKYEFSLLLLVFVLFSFLGVFIKKTKIIILPVMIVTIFWGIRIQMNESEDIKEKISISKLNENHKEILINIYSKLKKEEEKRILKYNFEMFLANEEDLSISEKEEYINNLIKLEKEGNLISPNLEKRFVFIPILFK